MKANDLITTRDVEQFFDPVKNMFLPDRYIKGECPVCHAKDQYGDSCEVCGSVYSPTELIAPYSALTGARAGDEVVGALLLPAVRSALRRFPARVDGRHVDDQRRRAPAERGPQQGERMAVAEAEGRRRR